MSRTDQEDGRTPQTEKLSELLELCLPALEEYARKELGERLARRESPEDLAQSVCREVLTRAAAGTFEVRSEGELRRWLQTAVRHKILGRARHLRALRRDADREVRMPSRDGSRIDALFLTLTTPSATARQREERERFAAAFGKLDAQAQLVVQWSCLDGLAHREIAERLGISESYSRTLLSRTLARLARLAAEDEAE